MKLKQIGAISAARESQRHYGMELILSSAAVLPMRRQQLEVRIRLRSHEGISQVLTLS